MHRLTPTHVLHRLLDESQCFAPEYADHMTNHLPMALAALEGLGADEARLREFFSSCARRLVAGTTVVTAATVLLPEDGWLAWRGHRDRFESLSAMFAAALASRGRETVLREVLPLLVTGVGAAAFHGVIRTAHAVESHHERELAAALAYWSVRWAPLPPPDATSSGAVTSSPCFETVAGWLGALEEGLVQRDPDWHPVGRLISEGMEDAARTNTYRELAGQLHLTGREPVARLQELARWAASRYAATRHFTVLHLATGSRAVRVLVPWLPADPAALAPVWHAVAAAVLASQATLRWPQAKTSTPPLDWSAVCARARDSDDDHVIKLVHAMLMQQAQAPDPVWLAAATAAVTA